MKSEPFKLTLPLDSSCGGHVGDSLGHVLVVSEQKQIFLKGFGILASTRSTCTGLAKINKSYVHFFIERFLTWMALLVFNCVYAFIYFLDSPRHIVCLRLPVSRVSAQHPASRGNT